MSVPSFRNSRSKVRRRRSHHALKETQVATCPKCNAPTMPHRACAECGYYNGRQTRKVEVVPTPKKEEKKAEKKEVKADAEEKKEEKVEEKK